MQNLNIIIIENDEMIRRQFIDIIAPRVKSLYPFSDAIEALNNINNIKPDIIISELNMPNLSGVYLYNELLKNNLNIPIIFISTFEKSDYFIEAIKLDIYKFIAKPIDFNIIIKELEKFQTKLLEKEESLKIESDIFTQLKMAAMGEMLTNIAHQWRQPLNTISICSSGIKLEKEFGNIIDKNDSLDNMISRMNDAVNYMNTTLNDFQSYLKPNKYESTFYIKKTLEKVDKLIISQLKTFDINIIKDIEDTQVYNYENELIQVLINIKKNAIDELSKVEHVKIIKIGTKKIDNKLIISIHDNAGGIPEKYMNNIFQLYFTTKKEEGNGIGLHMSKQIVQKHLKGTITAVNEELIYEDIKYMGAKFNIEIEIL
ncbi:hybrid sensor histidine kinase/response regulator [Arcobacter peruensis]|uniref:hybrid sensor histidine kinase/response regulator n=1 Tax=Arcobacter peruensis TaxID=2320140 RepID=UPI000F0851E4|nr:hybrid sensor histidine kinase/response regulator [Arcobacter peruensis]